MFAWLFTTHRTSAFWVYVLGPASPHCYVIVYCYIHDLFSYLTLAIVCDKKHM